jgi:hypothetical protein
MRPSFNNERSRVLLPSATKLPLKMSHADIPQKINGAYRAPIAQPARLEHPNKARLWAGVFVWQ